MENNPGNYTAYKEALHNQAPVTIYSQLTRKADRQSVPIINQLSQKRKEEKNTKPSIKQ
jgi:hypothetical protein